MIEPVSALYAHDAINSEIAGAAIAGRRARPHPSGRVSLRASEKRCSARACNSRRALYGAISPWGTNGTRNCDRLQRSTTPLRPPTQSRRLEMGHWPFQNRPVGPKTGQYQVGHRNVSVRPLDAICDLMNVRLAESDVVKFLRAALAERARSCPLSSRQAPEQQDCSMKGGVSHRQRNVSVRPLDAICDPMNVRLAESDVVKFFGSTRFGLALELVASGYGSCRRRAIGRLTQAGKRPRGA